MAATRPGSVGRAWGTGLCAVAVVCAALAAAGWLRFTGAHDRIGSYPAVAAGTSRTVTFDEPGGMTVYFESPCFACDGDSADYAPNLTVTGPDGTELDVEGYATDGTASPRHSPGFFSYERGDVHGAPVYTLTITQAGDHRIEVGDSSEQDAELRIGPSLTRVQITGIVLAVVGSGLAAVALVAGTIVLIVASRRRRRWRAHGGLQVPNPAPGPPPPTPKPPPPPPPPPPPVGPTA